MVLPREEADKLDSHTRPAFVFMIENLLRLIWMLLYALCSNVGIITLYRLQRMGRSFVHWEYQARRALMRERARLVNSIYYGARRYFEPFSQFVTIFSYIRSARGQGRDNPRIPWGTVSRVALGKLAYPLRRFIATVFNIAAPIAAVWLLVLTVQNATRQSYGLRVTYNGTDIGTVRSEAMFDEAQRRMTERIVDGTHTAPEGAVFSLEKTPASSYTDLDTMANRMIRFTGKDLFEGYGLYVDRRFIGSLENCQPLLDFLAGRLDGARTGTFGETVQFNHSISVRSGLYTVASKTTDEKIRELFDSKLSSEKTYTVQAGDTPNEIAYLNGITPSELERLNPEVMTKLFVGDKLTIAHSVPYLRILSKRTESYQEDIAFSTERVTDHDELLGYFEVEQEGEVGKRSVTSLVTYLDDEIISSEVIAREVVREPVPKRIVVGGRRPVVSQAVPGNVEDIIESLGGEAFIWPVDGGKITMPIWGYYNHTGNDITGISAGTTIRAAASGVVTYSGYTAGGYGRHIIITHPNGMQTLYAHNSANYVQVGDEVAQGQAIAAVGQTGNAFGNHCHFEIREGGRYLDARHYIGSVSPR